MYYKITIRRIHETELKIRAAPGGLQRAISDALGYVLHPDHFPPDIVELENERESVEITTDHGS